ncbi:MAG: NAD(P)/FAD-dependent oxidoreductase [Deltaproteobacteria bacterium]|nr:NAD(P)/FAD-dependent oxidoreductase [Deltaproteobacteria bacterium]
MNKKGNKIFDVIIAGAGPAGSKTAIELAEKGYHVLLIEKEQFPRYKPCGGGMPTKTLTQIGFDITPLIETYINGTRLTFNSRNPVTIEARGIGAMVSRERFDTFLARKAAGAGALLMEHCRVFSIGYEGEMCLVETDRGRFHCRAIVGADGAKGVVAGKAGLKGERELATAIDKRVEVDKEIMASLENFTIMDYGVVPYGYAWIFPKRDHVSVGIYTTMKNLKDLELRLDRFISRQHVLRGGRILSTHWHPVPLSRKKKRLHGDKILLVGDAACLAEPFFGEGIANALKSASIAAAKLDDFLSGRTKGISGYSEEIYKSITWDFRYARIMQNLFYRNPLRSHRLLGKKKYMGKWFALTIKGEMTYRGLFFRTLLTLPRWIGSYRD